MHTEFWCGNLKERRYLKTLGVDGRMILRWNKNIRWEGFDVLFWLRIGVTGELPWVINVRIP